MNSKKLTTVLIATLLTSQANAGWFCRLLGKEDKKNNSALQQALHKKLTAVEIETRAMTALNQLGLHESKELLKFVETEIQLEALETIVEQTAHLDLGRGNSKVIENILNGIVNETQLYFFKYIASSRTIWIYDLLRTPGATRTSHLELLQDLFVKESGREQFEAFSSYISASRYDNLLRDLPNLKISFVIKIALETKTSDHRRFYKSLISNYLQEGGRSAVEFEKTFSLIMEIAKDPSKMEMMHELTEIMQLRFWQLNETLSWIAQVSSKKQGHNLSHAITTFFLYKNESDIPLSVRLKFYDLVIATTSPTGMDTLSRRMSGRQELPEIEQILREGIR